MTSFCTLSSEMLSVFCLQPHELYQAGISPDEALLILSEDAPPDGEKFLLQRLCHSMDQGETLSGALQKEHCFSPIW